MYERYCMLRDLKGLLDAEVARICDLPKSTFSDWKSGKGIPKTDKLYLIAKCLGTTIEYLYAGEDTRENAPLFDAEHIELITLYSKLEKEQKEAVFALLRSFCSK